MQKVSGRWQGGKKIALSLNPDREIVIDENGPKATDLVLAGLIGCSSGVLTMLFEKMRLELHGLEITVEAERDPEPPKLFTKISLIYRIEVDKGLENKVISVIKLSKKYCTVFNILNQSTPIEICCYINGVKANYDEK
ncbi:OsmC family protein [Desulfosporosinus sp. PR]|uniref:OsmC family protein n=1 Tax=Candidatus Desulfosporosinus nitrosoreducens TaxID=3401928 RepID=UPI0027F3AA93|nr:OsmC family protein [Desulfosporosinus sp. PR]MDQ7094593.1 OsmC family protein [Desulfosporosinus sp. PR]